MGKSSYLDTLLTVTDAKESLQRASEAASYLGPDSGGTVTDFLRQHALPSGEPKDSLGTVVGGILGASICQNHRVLGLVGGASLGRNVPALFDPLTKRAAALNLMQTGSGIVGQVVMPGFGPFGFLLGWLAGGAAIYLAGSETGAAAPAPASAPAG